MMRKLAVTVFAMSLTLIGCGSSSTSKKDTGPDAQSTADAGVKLDVVVTQDTNPVTTPDTGVDTAKPTDVAPTDVSVVDVAKPDVTGDVTPVADTRDGSPADKTPDTFVKTDTVIIATDAPADTTPVPGDAGSEVGGDAQVD